MPHRKTAPKLNVGEVRLGKGLSIGFFLTVLLTIGLAFFVHERPAPLPTSIELKTLVDPDGLLSLDALPPNSNAWLNNTEIPVNHDKGVTWLLFGTTQLANLELTFQHSAKVATFDWDDVANRYIQSEQLLTKNLSIVLSKANAKLLRFESDSSSLISIRKSTDSLSDEDTKIIATFFTVAALLSWLILTLIDSLQLYFLRANWNYHANYILISTSQLLVVLSQSDLNSLALDFDFTSLAVVSWTLLGVSELLSLTTQHSSQKLRTFRNTGLLCLLVAALTLPQDVSIIVLSIISVTIVGLNTSISSALNSLITGIFYVLLALNHTLLRPIWPTDHLAFQSTTVGFFSALGLMAIIRLARTYASQREEFEKLQYQLRHEHSARLYITSSTAHELNNPINFISSGVGLQLEQFGELRDLVDVVFYDVDDPDAIDLKNRFDSTLRSILNITLDIQAGALRSAASLDHLRGLSPANNEIVSTFWSLRDILNHALDRVELQFLQSARSFVLLDLTQEQANSQLSTNLYFLSDAIGKLLVIALSQSPEETNVVRVYREVSNQKFHVLKIAYPGDLPTPDSNQEDSDRLDQLEHINQCLRLINCQITCSHNVQTKSSTLSVYIPKSGV